MAIVVAIFLLFNFWASVGTPRVAGQVVRTATITLTVGETTTYEYFNITLVDINPVSGTILVNVTGVQGAQMATVEDTYVDIFGDGTIEIKTTFVSSSDREAIISVEVDIEALANVACNILSRELEQVNETGLLPPNITKQFADNLNLAEQYKNSGWYDDAINLAWQTLNELRSTVALATEAKKAILDAKSALNNPSSVCPGCEGCPLSIQLKVQDKIDKAEQYYNEGDFQSALQYAQDALQLIKDCCNACKAFPDKKEEVLKYIKTYGSGIPSDLFNGVYSKIKEANQSYTAGDCVKAISYLDDAMTLAESIVTNWNKAMKCREDLLHNITLARKNYYIIYNNTVIKIYLDDISKKAENDLYDKIRSGYFLSAMSLCQNLRKDLMAREQKFNETREIMMETYNHIMEIQAEGIKINGSVWKVFNEGVELLKNGNYDQAQTKFIEASNIADRIKGEAIDARRAKNRTMTCLTRLQAEGINTTCKLFKNDMDLAQRLYSEGRYLDAKNTWDALYEKCNSSDIKRAIERRKKAHSMYSNLTVKRIPLPSNLTTLIEQADTAFKNCNFTMASTQYQEAINAMDRILEISKKEQQTVSNGRRFLKQNYKWGMNVAKWFGIPIVEERLNELGKLINQTQSAYAKAEYGTVEQDINKINAIMTDIDGDNVKNWNDPVPYVPNYYLVGLVTALLLIFVNIIR